MKMKITVHCSDSDNPAHDNIDTIDRWHKARGFKSCGYHFLIRSNGTIEFGRKYFEKGAHVKGYNDNNIGICLHGKSEFTDKQFQSLSGLCSLFLHSKIVEKIDDINGHHYYDEDKSCPNFSVDIFKRKYLDYP